MTAGLIDLRRILDASQPSPDFGQVRVIFRTVKLGTILDFEHYCSMRLFINLSASPAFSRSASNEISIRNFSSDMLNPGMTPATAGPPDANGLQTYRGSFRADDLPSTHPTPSLDLGEVSIMAAGILNGQTPEIH